MRKIIKKFPNARLETCGMKKSKHEKSHLNGCYLKLTDNETSHGTGDLWVITHFDKNNELAGIEFVDGIPFKSKKKRRKKNG